jgi:hypothetical protein
MADEGDEIQPVPVPDGFTSKTRPIWFNREHACLILALVCPNKPGGLHHEIEKILRRALPTLPM